MNQFSSANGTGDSLSTISQDGVIPTTRMASPAAAQEFALRLIQQDERRSYKRSRVSGLVAGFPPYRATKLREAGRPDACNANFNTASAYMENASGAFYDLFSEAPGHVGIKTSHGKDEEDRAEYSTIMSAEADRIIDNDKVWDYEMQRSQWEMVLHGCGPLIFEDAFKVLPRSLHCGDLKVPERTVADSSYWEIAFAEIQYYPPELYAFIINETAASAVGWDVEFTKKVIANAMDIQEETNQAWNWEFYQEKLKNNSLEFINDSLVCKLCVMWWKEFDGTITQAIVERDSNTSGGTKYLFFRQSRYKDFSQCVHPMYFDRGNGGFHHSVTGLGVKMYSAMEFENRLLCRLMDGAFAPKVLFKPTSAESAESMQLAHLGDYGVMPKGWEAVQSPMSGFINEGLAMYKTSSELMSSNLSAYRQQVETKQGNPETARGRMLDASQQSALSKTTFSRYYRQMDILYTEVVRRLCNLNSTDERAKEFQKRCVDKGVPRECFGRVESVEAIRVVGEGNAFLRKATLMEMASLAPSLPEQGMTNWKNDLIAASCGQKSVLRYNPPQQQKKIGNDQQFEALVAVTMMKNGVPPIVTNSQNPVTFAGTFLSAATQSLQSLKQGADPHTVVAFLELAGPAILSHLRRFAQDPIRKGVFQEMFRQWKQLASITDKLKTKVAQMTKQRQTQKQQSDQVLNEIQLKNLKAKADISTKMAKTKSQLAISAAKAKQGMVLQDAQVASQIQRENQRNRLAAFSEE